MGELVSPNWMPLNKVVRRDGNMEMKVLADTGRLALGSSVKLEGRIKESKGQGQEVEFEADVLNVLGDCDPAVRIMSGDLDVGVSGLTNCFTDVYVCVAALADASRPIRSRRNRCLCHICEITPICDLEQHIPLR